MHFNYSLCISEVTFLKPSTRALRSLHPQGLLLSRSTNHSPNFITLHVCQQKCTPKIFGAHYKVSSLGCKDCPGTNCLIIKYLFRVAIAHWTVGSNRNLQQ